MQLSSCREPEVVDLFSWTQLPQVPDSVGFAGCYAGVCNGYLLVAGGSNFAIGSRPWTGGSKFWNDKVLAYDKNKHEWKEIGKLPMPMGYGVSLNWKDGILFIGGADQRNHYRNVYYVTYNNGELNFKSLPDLPGPLANSCGSIVNGILYVAGGLSSPASSKTGDNFWSLDLEKPRDQQEWKILPSWPGKDRMLAVAGVINNEFYLISGARLSDQIEISGAKREYLTDAYVYNPVKGWSRIAELPYSVTAAPSPAYTSSKHNLLIFGGDDGVKSDQNMLLKDRHPGFRSEIISYNILDKKWNIMGSLPIVRNPNPETNPNASTWAPVTTPLVIWEDKIVIPQGEARPGVRTNRVLIAKEQ